MNSEIDFSDFLLNEQIFVWHIRNVKNVQLSWKPKTVRLIVYSFCWNKVGKHIGLYTPLHSPDCCQPETKHLPSPDQALIFEEDCFPCPNWGWYPQWKWRKKEKKNLKVVGEWPFCLPYIPTNSYQKHQERNKHSWYCRLKPEYKAFVFLWIHLCYCWCCLHVL